ncbi:MAG: hypothetical protein AAGC68_04440 [Verrucomicrobiota bacterium]
MKKIAYLFAILLIALGAIGYFGWEAIGAAKQSLTAAIPAFIGILVLLGAIIAEKNLKAGMHISVLFAFLGALAGLGRLIPGAMKGSLDWSAPSTVLISVMTGLCLVFTVLAVRSFIAARKATG